VRLRESAEHLSNNDNFPATAGVNLTPAKVFNGQDLGRTAPSDMIRLFVNLQACCTTNQPQCIHVDHAEADADTYAVVLRGMLGDVSLSEAAPGQELEHLRAVAVPESSGSRSPPGACHNSMLGSGVRNQDGLARRRKEDNVVALENVMPIVELTKAADCAHISVPCESLSSVGASTRVGS